MESPFENQLKPTTNNPFEKSPPVQKEILKQNADSFLTLVSLRVVDGILSQDPNMHNRELLGIRYYGEPDMVGQREIFYTSADGTQTFTPARTSKDNTPKNAYTKASSLLVAITEHEALIQTVDMGKVTLTDNIAQPALTDRATKALEANINRRLQEIETKQASAQAFRKVLDSLPVTKQIS